MRGTNFRCYERVAVELPAGLVGVVGPNGAGKTSLIEMAHFGCLAYSPRTSADPQLIRLGSDFLRVETDARVGAGPVRVELGYRPGEPKRISVAGAAERSQERLLARFPVLVFTPDRLRVVKGAPALRRAYFDRVLARLWPLPARAAADYGRALAQRNHLLRRIRAGAARPDALDAWDAALARAGAEVAAARMRLVSRLTRPLGERLAALGGDAGGEPLAYLPAGPAGEEELRAALAGRRSRDVERGATGVGPHLADFRLADGGRDLRLYGSQGEQRRILLALLLAEADVLAGERDEPPLLLLDDVTGEFDARRRELLLGTLAGFDQAVVTTTDEADLAGAAGHLVRVRDGEVLPA